MSRPEGIDPSKLHPTIFVVRLGVVESGLWRTSRIWRFKCLRNFCQLALAQGKTKVAVHGADSDYGVFSAETGDRV